MPSAFLWPVLVPSALRATAPVNLGVRLTLESNRMSDYRKVIIETYWGETTHASGGLRARPLPGQGHDASMNVECSTKMRNAHPVGTKFLVSARLKNKEGGPNFLYVHYNHDYQVVSDQAAQAFLKQRK